MLLFTLLCSFGCLLQHWCFFVVCVLMKVCLQTPCWKSRFDANTCFRTCWCLVSEQPKVQLGVDTMNNKHVISKIHLRFFCVLSMWIAVIYIVFLHNIKLATEPFSSNPWLVYLHVQQIHFSAHLLVCLHFKGRTLEQHFACCLIRNRCSIWGSHAVFACKCRLICAYFLIRLVF